MFQLIIVTPSIPGCKRKMPITKQPNASIPAVSSLGCKRKMPTNTVPAVSSLGCKRKMPTNVSVPAVSSLGCKRKMPIIVPTILGRRSRKMYMKF